MLTPMLPSRAMQGSYDRGAYKSIYFNMERETVYMLLVRHAPISDMAAQRYGAHCVHVAKEYLAGAMDTHR